MLLNSEQYIDNYIYCLVYFINFEKFLIKDENEKTLKFPCGHTTKQIPFLESSLKNKCPDCGENIYNNDEFCESHFGVVLLTLSFMIFTKKIQKKL